MEPLPDEIPESNEGGSKPFIRAFGSGDAVQSHYLVEQFESSGRRDGISFGESVGRRFFSWLFMCMYTILYTYYKHTHLMNTSRHATTKWKPQFQALWPALKGSLAQVYKPCIRKNCPACACGDKHSAWILSFTQRGRRRCLYVPLALVPVIRQGLKNGRRLEELLYRVGPALVKEYRQSRKNRP